MMKQNDILYHNSQHKAYVVVAVGDKLSLLKRITLKALEEADGGCCIAVISNELTCDDLLVRTDVEMVGPMNETGTNRIALPVFTKFGIWQDSPSSYMLSIGNPFLDPRQTEIVLGRKKRYLESLEKSKPVVPKEVVKKPVVRKAVAKKVIKKRK